MRAAVMVALVLWLAGCLGASSSTQSRADSLPTLEPQGRRVAGLVVDDELAPIPDALVRATGTNVSAQTNASGRFEMTGLPARNGLLLTAEHPDYRSASLRVDLLYVPAAEVRFVLALKPVNATHVTTVTRGMIFCQVFVGAHEGPVPGNLVSCGRVTPDTVEEARVPFSSTTVAATIELVWKPGQPAAAGYDLDVAFVLENGTIPLGRIEAEPGTEYVAMFVGPSTFAVLQGKAGLLHSRPTVGPSFLDHHSPANAGLAVQQSFTLYTSVFYGEAPSASWSALTK